MKCFFHLVSARDEILDEAGIEVASVEEARTEALRAIDELRREDRALSNDWYGWTLRVVDSDGRVLSSMPLRPNYRGALGVYRVDDVADSDAGPGSAEPH